MTKIELSYVKAAAVQDIDNVILILGRKVRAEMQEMKRISECRINLQ